MFLRSIPGLLALALVASAARASDYSDFRIPPHSWSQLQLAMDGSYSPSLTNTNFTQQKQSTGQGNLSAVWLHGHDSERLQHTIQISGGASGLAHISESQSDRTSPFAYSRDEHTQDARSGNETWQLFAGVRPYPLSIPLGLTARLSARGDYGQDWSSESQTSVFERPDGDQAFIDDRSSEAWDYAYHVDASLAPGWGRVRDATGVQRIEFVEARLLNDRVIHGPLQPATKQRLADLFYTESKFALVHDLPDRHFWAEFERILREDPAVRAEALDAYAILHAGDPLVVSRGFGRQVGSFIGPVMTFAHQNEVHRLDLNEQSRSYFNDTLRSDGQSSRGRRTEEDQQEVRAGAEATFEQPLGLNWQLSVLGSATSDLRALDRDLRVVSSLSLHYWQGERWYWEASVSQERRTGTHLPRDMRAWGVVYGGSIRYYLEDHVAVELGLDGSQAQDLRLGSPQYSRIATIRLGLSYRRGSLTAPGLVAPVRPVS